MDRKQPEKERLKKKGRNSEKIRKRAQIRELLEAKEATQTTAEDNHQLKPKQKNNETVASPIQTAEEQEEAERKKIKNKPKQIEEANTAQEAKILTKDDYQSKQNSKSKRKHKELVDDTPTNQSQKLSEGEEPQSNRQKIKHAPIKTTTGPQISPSGINGTTPHLRQELDPSIGELEKKDHRKLTEKTQVKHNSRLSRINNNEDTTAYWPAKPQGCAGNNLQMIVAPAGTGNSKPIKKSRKNNCPQDLGPLNTPNPQLADSQSICQEGENDPELDWVLIHSKNLHILHSESHLPQHFKTKLPFLTCRQILSTKWLDISHLNELSTLFGLKYKKGQFTETEQTIISKEVTKYCETHGLSRAEFASTIVQKKQDDLDGREKLKGLVPMISEVLPGRPMVSIWKYIRRAYDPQAKLGRWTPEEEEALQQAHRKYGPKWTLISRDVRRSAEDCRDRWKNYTHVKGTRKQGKWSKDEEERLVRLMTQSKLVDSDPKDLDTDGRWTWISSQMGGTRSCAQCRVKWVESLKPKLASGSGRRHWTDRDILILAQQLKKHDLRDDEVGFNWKELKAGVECWVTLDHAYIQRRWKTLKKYMLKKHQKRWQKNHGSEGPSKPPLPNNQQIIQDVLAKWSAKAPALLDLPVKIKAEVKKDFCSNQFADEDSN